MYTFPDGRVRPVTTVYTARSQPIHGSVYGRVRRPLHGRASTAVRHVHTSTPQLKGRVRAMYTSVYTGRDATLRQWAMYTAVRRHVHGRVHVPYTAVYMFVYTGRVHGRIHGLYAVTGRTRP